MSPDKPDRHPVGLPSFRGQIAPGARSVALMRFLGPAIACLAVVLVGCSTDTSNEDAGDTMTCSELADEAVRISEGEDVELLKVREPKVDIDKQDTGWDTPTGTDEVVVLRCIGAGVWSDGTDSNVRLEVSVDADGDQFASYAPVL